MSEPLPRGWREATLADLVYERMDRVGRAANPIVLSSTKHHGLVPSDEYFQGRIIYSSDLSNYKRVCRDWFAYATNHLAEGSIGLQQNFDVACVSPIYTVFECGNSLFPSFLYRVLKSPSLVAKYRLYEQASVDRRGAVRFGDFAKIRVRFPSSLAEQQRIVEILDLIDEQIQRSTGAIAKFDEVRKASVRVSMSPGLECFREVEASELHSGVHRRNGSWCLVPLGSLLSGIDAGNSPDLDDIPAGPDQWGVLKVSAIGNDMFHPGENKVVRDNALRVASLCVRPGDLLMTRANTPQLVGRSCIVGNTPAHLMLCDKTLRLRLSHPYVTVNYVQMVLGMTELRRQIEIEATGTSGSMKNISQHAISQLMIPVGDRDDVERVANANLLFGEELLAMRWELDKVRELKQGLVADLLTGRSRVTAAGVERVGTG
jgi:type I restriction enzyme, S subunit